jgi:dihydroorotate dehydrogenase
MGHHIVGPNGWYRRVARPLLFALPPEAAHRIAHALLGLPLPWERLGRAARDPGLRVRLARIDLANPVGLAAGFDKQGSRLDALGRLGFGYVVAGTFTRRHRDGNARPRIARYPNRASLTNAMGLPNPGADVAARNLASTPRTAPRFASIADEDIVDVLGTHALLEPHVDALELNVSCPNVSWGRDRDNEQHLARLLEELGRRRTRPLFVKLPPFRSEIERDVVLALARIAQDGGADGLTCSNTLPVRDGNLAPGGGGLSGRALFEGTLSNVEDVLRATGGELPINASGGVFSAADAHGCLDAGATTVQVYTGLVFEGPGIVGDLTRGLATAMGHRTSAQAAGTSGGP